MVLMYDYGRLRGLFAQVYLQTEHASATSQKQGGGYIPHPPPGLTPMIAIDEGENSNKPESIRTSERLQFFQIL